MSGDTLVLDWDTPDAEPPRRRRRWPWLVAVLVVLALVVAAFFAGEWVARDLVIKAVKQQISSRLDLAADQEIDVQIDDPSLLLALATGTVGQVSISADGIAVGAVSGDVSVTLRDLSIRAPFSLGSGEATVALTAEQLRSLLANVDGFPAETVGLAAPNVTASTELSFFGASVPLALALTPSAAEGDLVLTPASVQLAGADITAEGLRERLGALADPVLAGYHVCIAQYLPAGVPLVAARVEGDQLIADFTLSGDLLTDASARAEGTCD